MSGKLLYYPYINLPESKWTTMSLLYWDEVHVIVPDLYRENPDRLENNMLQLVRAGLVTQLFPDEYVRNLPRFDHAFLDLINCDKFDLPAKQKSFARGALSRIHIQKIGANLLEELQAQQIVRRESHEWYLMERHTARMFLTYLATVISKKEGFTAATDNTRNIDFSLEENPWSCYRLRNRTRFLNDLIPYPVSATPLQLMKFKETYGAQLGRFRTRLERIILELSGIAGREERELFYQLSLKEILDERDEIFDRLNHFSFGKIVFGTVFGLAAAGLGFDSGHPLLGSLVFGNAVYSALEGTGQPEETGGLAYLALIDKKFRPATFRS